MHSSIFSPITLAVTDSVDFGEAVSFLLAGFTVVMLTLLALAFVCGFVGFLFRKFPVLAGKPPVAARKTANSGSSGAADARLVAVIGAAIDQAYGGQYRIKSIKPIGKS